MDDTADVTPTQQPVELARPRPVPFQVGTLDIQGKLVLIRTAEDMNARTQATTLASVGKTLTDAGAAAVVLLRPGTELSALTDDDLARVGLRRMNATELTARDDKASNGG